ncbi:MAG TPA: hypothetical protein VJS17_05670 [Pyrinomonadaceae bacterium]|nr:hypothetical protein [Pyrinomonadaceae bacterium]
MNTDDDGRDPQNTLPPQFRPRGDEARGRRLKLGTPRATAGGSTSQAPSDVHRGFTLGKKTAPAASEAPKRLVQPWILFVAGGALLLLLVALLVIQPSGVSSAEGLANEKLLAQYSKYIEKKNGGVNVDERKKEVVTRLQAVAWAKAVGDKSALESELTALLFLDNDKASPLYQYSVKELKELGPSKKRPGL